jgi:hypothetical protein
MSATRAPVIADWSEGLVGSGAPKHDLAYCQGGTREQRQHADEELRRCVADRTGDEKLAELMYSGVRVGGSPYFYNEYRWGYGWNYQRRYEALSEDELRQVERKLAHYRASLAHPPGEK